MTQQRTVSNNPKEKDSKCCMFIAGLSSLGVLGVPWHTQILADQLTLFQQGGTDFAHLITIGTPGPDGPDTFV